MRKTKCEARAMRLRDFAILAASTLVVASCGGEPRDRGVELTPAPPNLSGVYAGRWPCSNCEAILATLWLRPDGAFVLRQAFADAADASASDEEPRYGLGRWRWDEVTAEIVLDGPGPDRRLTTRGSDALEMIVSSPLEHRLDRDPASPPFVDRVRLDGESVVAQNGVQFTECLTGLTWPVAATGAIADLRRLHRRLNPSGRVALATIEGRLTTPSGDDALESLVVEDVVTLKPGTGCRG